ncbi:glycosyltransferase [Mesorhizobium sp. INR15]|uniref:glycosyltransferase n=1 Tax=Mesorhizobium sp. INR15 TaxID=2654248 RepID=UPI0018965CBD|nr:glycosyltransferase [Mesorhizobium sp. INR15]QPC94097.1 glycosyltransferase [Mesorhizobium sp. INR15]
MKVRDIIRDTIWMPGRGYSGDHKPAISILLPTYRRGASGLFRRAVESVLGQTLEDIELIIVDDASTDGTADQISEFMRDDGRVSCLLHPRNIGLPAVSEFEAFAKARGNFIAFAFDDDFFYPDAMEQLLKHSLLNPNRVCYGNAIWRVPDQGALNGAVVRLGQSLSSYNLRSSNVIANCAVLLPRYIVDEIGFYDPNILMVRICDWDLWRRVGEFYLLHHIDIDVAEVTGPAQDDSLGRTYLLPSGACDEWMRATTRDLRPEDLYNVDVFEILPGLSSSTQSAIVDLAENHLAKRPWLRKSDQHPAAETEKTIFVLTYEYNASTTLCFEYLPKSIRGRIRIVSLRDGLPILELSHASCLIVVRFLECYQEWIRAAMDISIPVYYFIDDNLMELSSKENVNMPEEFSVAVIRQKLSKFSGVIVTSQALNDYFLDNLIHKNLFVYPVSYSKRPISLAAPRGVSGVAGALIPDLVIASIGGSHRQFGLRESILPAVQRLAGEGYRIHFVLCGGSVEDREHLSKMEGDSRIKVTFEPLQLDWNRALLQLAERRPDVLVHAPSRTINNRYKTLNVALCAYVLDAVLVVPNDKPYDIPSFDGAAVKVDPVHEPRAWLQALMELLSNRQSWDRYKQVNATFCRTHFSGERNVAVLNEIIENAPAVNSTLVESRLKGYFSKTPADAGNILNESLKGSLLELSALRSKIRRYRRFKPRLSRDDLWPHVSPAFDDIRRYVEANNIRGANNYLELSDAIQQKDFIEYLVPIKSGEIKAISCVFSSEGLHEGLLGIEFVSPSGEIAIQSTVALERVSLQLPVSFDMKGTIVPKDGIWRLRLFARSNWPIYALEFVTYSYLGWTRKIMAPFAGIEYVKPVQMGNKVGSGRLEEHASTAGTAGQS